MKKDFVKLTENWKFRQANVGGEYFPATVPGDVTRDMCNVLGENKLYVDLNYKKYKDFVHNDYEYVCTFDCPMHIFGQLNIYLEFLGVDTFSEISLNGVRLGETSNMFMGYKYDVKRIMRLTGNVLTVNLKSVFPRMKENKDEYVCIFEPNAMFLRKARYQFGWDWAPAFPAYGIWQDVLLYGEDFNAFENVRVRQNINGDVNFLIDLKKPSTAKITLEMDGQTITVPATGKTTVLNAKIKNPKLWWPNGMGDQPLYTYKLTLHGPGRELDVYEDYMAFRKVEYKEAVLDDNHLDFRIFVNDLPMYAIGSNWVPQDCLTGTVPDETYRRHIVQAKAANMNFLRIWGGGVYEKDIFYRLCDENGIMLMQETMISCSDFPADKYDFIHDVMVPELEYQLKRLQNHPCIAVWSGGNELYSPFMINDKAHTKFTEYLNRGMVHNFTDFPYINCSPFSYNLPYDMPNAGDQHTSTTLEFQNNPLNKIRASLHERDNSQFVSESAILEACSYQSVMQCTENEKVWPIEESPYIQERFGCNPFGGWVPFVLDELKEVTHFFGKPSSLREFIKHSAITSKEHVAMDLAFYQSKGSSGYLTWMFNDTWPNGSWAAVDYFFRPKGMYYAFTQGGAPVAPVLFENKEGKVGVHVYSRRSYPVTAKVEFGVRKIDGTYVKQEEKTVNLAPASQKFLKTMPMPKAGEYVYARVTAEGNVWVKTYFDQFGIPETFHSDYEYDFKQVAEGKYEFTFKANEYARYVRIRPLTDTFMTLSDNFFDLEKGDVKTITVYADSPVTKADFEVKDINQEW
ncbi:MAG: hypothetical protein E7363_02795 [Clostridiales bacterium]|nr:hypothetical protein [Clostridiales bacterium]